METEKEHVEETKKGTEGPRLASAPKLRQDNVQMIVGEDQDLPTPEEEDEDGEIPEEKEEKEEGFDNDIKDVIQRVSVMKIKHDNSEMDDTQEEPFQEAKERSESTNTIEDQYDIVTDKVREEIKTQVNSSLQQSTLNEEDENGEQIIRIVENVFLIFPNGNKSISVSLKITDLTLYINHSMTEVHEQTPDEEYSDDSEGEGGPISPLKEQDHSLAKLIENKCKMKYFEIPLGMLYCITTMDLSQFENVLVLTTKDNRRIGLKLMNKEDQDVLEGDLRTLAFPNEIDDNVAFMNFKYTPSNYFKKEEKKESPAKLSKKILDFKWDTNQKLPADLIEKILEDSPLDKNGWDVYDFEREYERQGVNQGVQKFHTIMPWKDEENTYPEKVYIPDQVSHATAFSSFEFRSKKRFPALSYYYSAKGTSMWRCAQPCNGFFNSRNADDERMFKAIMETCSHHNGLLIVDARSYISANGNKIKGGGTENTEHYENSELHFGSIDNIHGVRDAYKQCFPTWHDQWYTKNYDDLMDKINPQSWIYTLHYILKAVKKVAHSLRNENRNVVVHCSDGWDRTAEICGLTQIILDPYYRTLKGLEVIIEKEWVSFGFQFNKRCGHFGDDNKYGNDVSPVFIQFLDCLHQLLNQFPTAFQYNKNLLKFLSVEVYKCKFGTFVFDHDWSRRKFGEEIGCDLTQSVSIWTYVNDNCEQFLNPMYAEESGVIDPKVHISLLKFWEEHFLNWYEHSGEGSGPKTSDPYNDMARSYVEHYERQKLRLSRTKESYQDLKSKYDELTESISKKPTKANGNHIPKSETKKT